MNNLAPMKNCPVVQGNLIWMLGVMYMLVKYDDFVFRIARQLNYKRTLTSVTTARIDLAGFPYEAFEQGGKVNKSLGPRREKTCLRGFRQSEFQTSLLSYRD